jgi:hypothetical protein
VCDYLDKKGRSILNASSEGSLTKRRSKNADGKERRWTKCRKKKRRMGQNVEWKKRRPGQNVEWKNVSWDKTSISKKRRPDKMSTVKTSTGTKRQKVKNFDWKKH